MRYQGRIEKWKDEQGFGFIRPRGGGPEVFVHIRSFSDRRRRPVGGEIVSYRLGADDLDRVRARDVAFVGDSERSATLRRSAGWLWLPVFFFAVVGASVLIGRLPFTALGIYLTASIVTFLVYAKDKSAAQRSGWRTSESTLHLLSLIGGWPGAHCAHALLRHKSRKQAFRVVFWITVAMNCLGFAWLLTPTGAEFLRSIVIGSDLLAR